MTSSRPSAAHTFLAAASLAAAGIHFAVMGEHFQEYAPFGVFFSVVAWLQALWAVGLVLGPTRWLLAAGLVGNLGVVAVWIVSRTAGLPLGPEPGVAEAASFVDVLSTVLEAVIAVGCGAVLARPGRAASLRSRAGWVAILVSVLVLAPLTTVAIASSADHATVEAGPGAEDHHEGAGDRSGLARVDLGGGRTLQALVDARAQGPAQVHLTFFDAKGGPLDVTSVTLEGISPSGSTLDIAVSKFETGHYAATTDLEPGLWEFKLDAITRDGEQIATTFGIDVDAADSVSPTVG
ncbi:hypothetical protein HRbin12_01635 [bacterium HR12]|nr:hypothetical protein HRbin12_01635 [bacterium HR12]